MRNLQNSGRNLLGLLEMAVASFLLLALTASAQSMKPVKLECESLSTPLGMDAQRPMLSWKIQDSRPGARQLPIKFKSVRQPKWVGSGQGDFWDSGRVENRQFPGCAIWRFCARTEQNVTIGEFWYGIKTARHRLLVSRVGGRPGFSIRKLEGKVDRLRGIRTAPGARIRSGVDHQRRHGSAKGSRETNHDFGSISSGQACPARHIVCDRTAFSGCLDQWKTSAPIGATSSWRQMPWKTYTIRDVSNALRAGQNVMATEVVRYSTSGGGGPHHFSQTPMSAVLYVEAAGRHRGGYARAFRRVGERIECQWTLAGARIRRCFLERSDSLRSANFRL